MHGSWLGHYNTPLYSSPGLCISLLQCSNSGQKRASLFRALPWTPLLISHWPKEVTEPSPNSKGGEINSIAWWQKLQSHTAKSHVYNDGWYYCSRQPTTMSFSIHTCFFSSLFWLREWCQCPPFTQARVILVCSFLTCSYCKLEGLIPIPSLFLYYGDVDAKYFLTLLCVSSHVTQFWPISRSLLSGFAKMFAFLLKGIDPVFLFLPSVPEHDIWRSTNHLVTLK